MCVCGGGGTGIDDVRLCNRCTMHTLTMQVNAEVEKLEDQTTAIRAEIERYRGGGATGGDTTKVRTLLRVALQDRMCCIHCILPHRILCTVYML